MAGVEHHVLAAKRDVRREVSLEDINASLERSTMRLGAILAAPGASPGSEAEQHEHLVALADALAELRPEHCEVIRLRHLEGLPFAQVAADGPFAEFARVRTESTAESVPGCRSATWLTAAALGGHVVIQRGRRSGVAIEPVRRAASRLYWW